MAALHTYNVFFYFLLHLFNEKDVHGSSCYTPHDLPGCINHICEKKVCQTNPQCCDNIWDLNCAKIACHNQIYIDDHFQIGICQSIGTSCNALPCHTAHHSHGCQDIQCTNTICEIKPECCDKSWDTPCVDLACDINHGLCNNIPGACIIKPLYTNSHKLQHRHLLQHCSNDPCPGHQQRNPITCICECPSSDGCPGNQIYSGVLCQCGCATAPTCSAPQQFNAISCDCQCPTVLPCSFIQQFDTDTCKCITPITDCSMDPCPGFQRRNPITCDCECEVSITCPGNQEFNVFCECGCAATPICQAPKQFNPVLCDCECMILPCNTAQILNSDTCLCETESSITNIDTTLESICPSEPCPAGIQKRNPITCECECEVTTECPGNQDFNILCECQCAATPICNAKQQFNPLDCLCDCIQMDTCDIHQIWNADQCQCDNDTPSVIIPTSICPSDPCPGHLSRDPVTCACGCGNTLQCIGNQELNVFCECGCAATPICSSLQQFNPELCGCECRDITPEMCDNGEILNTNTCSCEVVQMIVITNRPTTSAPSTTSPTTDVPTTSNPTTKPTSSPLASSPTELPTDHPTTVEPTYNPSKLPTYNPSTTYTPSSSPTYDPSTTSQPSSYTIVKPMICRLDGDFDVLEEYLDEEDISIYEWADGVIKVLIHYNDPIISNSVILNIVNVKSGSIVIKYNLVIQRVEIFDIVLHNIDSTQYMTFADFVLPIVSNQEVIESVNNECAVIGQECDGIMSCCDTEQTVGILCIARSEAHINHGVCCIDYNNYGCSGDSDCCFENSYCDVDRSKCLRTLYKRDDETGQYDASGSKDEPVYVGEGEQSDAAVILPKDNDDYTYVQIFDIKGIVLSPSLVVLLVVVFVLMIGNTMCCIHEKWSKTKKAKKGNCSDPRISIKKSVILI